MKPKSLSKFLLALAVSFSFARAVHPTPLDDYVAEADPAYTYILQTTRHSVGYSVHVVSMTSQQWRKPSEVDRTVWQHELLIAAPWVWHSGNQHTLILLVDGGRNGKSATSDLDELIGLLASSLGTSVAVIRQIPNQPLLFADETEAKIEDEILAYGMNKFLVTGDPEWLVQLAMTKAVVRAIDTVQDFAETSDARPQLREVHDVVVIGGSKRGWATWLTAAVEAEREAGSRIRAILPASIDLLNMDEQFDHHWEAYGFYAPAIHDYADLYLPCRSKKPEGRAMREIIDPYSYRGRFTMPKLILNSAGDQFFLPDSSQFYYEGLPGPKRLRYTFNTDHSQAQDPETIILPTLSWLSDVLDEKESPQVTWTLQSDGSIVVKPSKEPKQVRLWQATNPNARDFRLPTIGATWTSSKLQKSADGTYIGRVQQPPQGWTAFSVEVTFAGSTLLPTPLESDEVFTTSVQVTPATLPFEGTACFCSLCVPSWSGWRSTLH